MWKQQLVLKSLKIHVCCQSWSNFPARNHCEGKSDLLYLCPLYCADLGKDTILYCRKTGNCGESREILKQGLSLEVKLRHKAQFLLSVCCVRHVASSQQVFEQQYLFVWPGFAVLCLLLPCFAWAVLLLLLCYTFTPVLFTKRSVLKGDILRIIFKSLWE